MGLVKNRSFFSEAPISEMLWHGRTIRFRPLKTRVSDTSGRELENVTFFDRFWVGIAPIWATVFDETDTLEGPQSRNSASRAEIPTVRTLKNTKN